MAINADFLVNITNNVLNAGANERTFSGLLLSLNEDIPLSNRVLSFSTLQSVADYFGETSEEYAIAPYYFNSFINAQKNVDPLLIARFIDEDVSPWIRGSSITNTLAQFVAITSGTVQITLDGEIVIATGINLSSSVSFSDVGVHIQTALRNASPNFPDLTVVYDSFYNAFILNTNEVGATHTVTAAASSPLTSMLKWTTADNPILSQGANAQTPTQNMDAILSEDKNWASFTQMFLLIEDYALELAKWANDHKFYMYSAWNEDVSGALSFKNLVSQADYASINLNKGDVSTALFSMSVGASINFDRANGLVTWASKQQNGLFPTVDTDSDSQLLIDNGINFYGDFSSVSSQYRFYEYGTITGPYVFIDNFFGFLWLRDTIQNATLELLKNTTRIPSSNRGYSLIRNTLAGVMSEALINGVCETGFTFDAETKALLSLQVGYDVSSEITNNGYYIQIIEQTPEQKALRSPLNINLWYANNGSVQRFNDNITLII